MLHDTITEGHINDLARKLYRAMCYNPAFPDKEPANVEGNSMHYRRTIRNLLPILVEEGLIEGKAKEADKKPRPRMRERNR